MSFEKSASCFPSLKPTVTLSFSKSPSAKATFSYGGSKPAYSVGGKTFNSSGYIVNPSRNAQIQARNAESSSKWNYMNMFLT